ncbi:MAG TPA: hypothetical protein VFF78_03950 [Anaerolineaceae bacterium]|nr:hypothetical protein [Anaerolineaceae bacterium]
MKFDLIATAGLVLLCVGVGLIYFPAALIVAGVGLILYALLGGATQESNKPANKSGGPK